MPWQPQVAGFDKIAGSNFGRASKASAPPGPKPGMVSDNPTLFTTNKSRFATA
jgi:hypothetical protein